MSDLSPTETFAAYRAGLITTSEFHACLAIHQIHGAIEGGQFTGYDYQRQEWLQASNVAGVFTLTPGVTA